LNVVTIILDLLLLFKRGLCDVFLHLVVPCLGYDLSHLVVSLPSHLVGLLDGVNAKDLIVGFLLEILPIIRNLKTLSNCSYLARTIESDVLNLGLEGEGLKLRDVNIGKLEEFLDRFELILEGHICILIYIAEVSLQHSPVLGKINCLFIPKLQAHMKLDFQDNLSGKR